MFNGIKTLLFAVSLMISPMLFSTEKQQLDDREKAWQEVVQGLTQVFTEIEKLKEENPEAYAEFIGTLEALSKIDTAELERLKEEDPEMYAEHIAALEDLSGVRIKE